MAVIAQRMSSVPVPEIFQRSGIVQNVCMRLTTTKPSHQEERLDGLGGLGLQRHKASLVVLVVVVALAGLTPGQECGSLSGTV